MYLSRETTHSDVRIAVCIPGLHADPFADLRAKTHEGLILQLRFGSQQQAQYQHRYTV